jgi:predicted anti-sigma-YlaC factor YlaD
LNIWLRHMRAPAEWILIQENWAGCMKCNAFEERVSDYIDGFLGAKDATLFREHALQCRACRSLLDDVKGTVRMCREQEELNTPTDLEMALAAISVEHAVLDCNGFQAFITEFLDGFVPAPAYHRFEEHASACADCSTLLTDVVYAVAACHSVHTFEEVEAPAALLESLFAIMPARKQTPARRLGLKIGQLADRLIPNPAHTARWTFATSVTLTIAILAFLFFGVSDDQTVAGIYREAHVKASELYSRGTDVYVQTDKAVAKLESVGYRLNEVWDTLGGEDKSADDVNRPSTEDRNSNKPTDSSPKN